MTDTRNTINRLNLLILGGAILISAMGGIVMVGWWVRSPALTQILPDFVPMQFNTGLCFLLSGCGVIAIRQNRVKGGALFGLGILGITLPTLLAYGMGFDLFLDELFAKAWIADRTTYPGRMAASTALSFTICAAGFATIRVAPSVLHARLTLAITLFVVFLLGSASAASYLIIDPQLVSSVQVTRMAVHTTAGFMLLGLCGTGLAIRDLFLSTNSRMWNKPLWIGFVISLIGVAGWVNGKNGLSKQQYDLIHRTLNNLQTDVQTRGTVREKALDRLFHSEGGVFTGFQSRQWRIRALNILEDFEAIDHVSFLDPEGNTLVDVHQEGEGFEWVPGEQVLCGHGAAPAGKRNLLFACHGQVDPSRLIIAKPYLEAGKETGTVMFVLDVTEMIHAMPRVHMPDFNLTVQSDGQEVFPRRLESGPPELSRFDRVPQTLFLYGHPLELDLFLKNTIPALGSQDIELVLSLCLGLLAALLTLQLRLHRERAAEAEALNQQLRAEARRRQAADRDLKRANRKLRASNRDLEGFAYAASHDLQEPLRKIVTFSERLLHRSGDRLDERGKDYLNRMVLASERMSTLITDLLDLSRVSTRVKPMELISLEKIMNEVLETLEVRIQESGAQVRVGTLPDITADPVHMRQLFQNLIGNALKFHRDGVPPEVHISCDNPDADPVCIRVSDNGIGIEPEHAERIFKPFSRLHGRREYPGSGVGLSICNKIIERHNGTITIEAGENGTDFIITLPRFNTEEGIHE